MKFLCLSYWIRRGEITSYSKPDQTWCQESVTFELLGSGGSEDGTYVMASWNANRAELCIRQGAFAGLVPVYYAKNKEYIVVSTSLSYLLFHIKNHPVLNIKGVKAFLRHGFIPGRETLLEQIFQLQPGHILYITPSGVHTTYDMPINTSLTFKNTSFKMYLKRSMDVVDSCINTFLKEPTQKAIALSGGYDSNYLFARARTLDTNLTPVSVGAQRGRDESNIASEISTYYNAQSEIAYVGAETFTHFEDIVGRLEGLVFEPGIFLQYELAKKTAEIGCETILCGECADQVYHENFSPKDFLPEEEYKFGSHPYELASLLILKKSGVMLQSFGIKAYYPYCSRKSMQLGWDYRNKNGREKFWHKAVCKKILDEQVFHQIEKKGGSTSLSALFENEREQIRWLDIARKMPAFLNIEVRPTKRFGPYYDYELQYYMCQEYLRLFSKIFIEQEDKLWERLF